MIFLLLLYTSNAFQLNMNNGNPSSMWSVLSGNLKSSARKWFINRAEQQGIKWNDLRESYVENLNELELFKKKIENNEIYYPSYYTQPFHGYDYGNLEWNAATEAEAATISISANYWEDVDPVLSERWLRYNTTRNIRHYMKKYSIREQTSILDMGCSIGISTEYLEQGFPKCTNILGVDLSPYFLATASYRLNKDESNIKYMHCNVENVPLQNNTFDMVSCNFLFHEVPHKPTIKIIQEAYRLLKPNGILAILDLDPEKLKQKLDNNKFRLWTFESTEPHIYDYYKNDISKTMTNVGFKHIESFSNDPLNSLWIGIKCKHINVVHNTPPPPKMEMKNMNTRLLISL